MRLVPVSVLLVCLARMPAAAAPPDLQVVTDPHGRVVALGLADERLAVSTNLRIPTRGWASMPSLDTARDAKASERAGRRQWAGRIEIAPGVSYRYEQALTVTGGRAELDLRVTADAKADVEGVFLWLHLPIAVFAGGRAELTSGRGQGKSATFPVTLPANEHFLGGPGDGLAAASADGKTRFALHLDRPFQITMQDERKWGGGDYGLFVQLQRGPLEPGQSVAAKATLTASLTPDTAPARLTVDAGKPLYRLDGFGGNYCFNTDSPVSDYTLANLRVAWARTEMHLKDWEPANDNGSPEEIDWAKFEARDRPGSQVRQDFEMARRIAARKIPSVISVWQVPDWLCAEPIRADGHRRVIPRDRWGELAESVAAYLLYARRKYGVEPELFSFNEADIGVMVLLTGPEHRDLIKLIGGRLAREGLKTRMLLGDTGNARGMGFTAAAAADPEAVKFVGAVAFHSWGGADAATYRRWAELADRLKLPLLVTELGVDANWRARPSEQPGYWLREAVMYQELLLHARPRGTMQWEFTADYSTVAQTKDPTTGKVVLTPTERFAILRHFCNLTPLGADALAVASDHPKVLLTAFAAGPADGRNLTLHIVNAAAARKATIAGLPAGLTQLRAVRTATGELFAELDPVPVRDGVVELDLAPRSLLTLTNLPTGEKR